MPPLLKRTPRRCAFVKPDGSTCSGYVVTEDGLQRLVDQGISVVADPVGRLCAFHSRTPEERYEMAVRGGSFSPKRIKKEALEREAERDPMPRQFAIAAYQLITRLLNAKLANVFPVEQDTRQVALGALLACAIYDPPYDRGTFVTQIMPRGVYMHDAALDNAQQELRQVIDELPREEQTLAWEMLATNA